MRRNGFSDEEEWQALCAELARLDEFDAKNDILRDQATGPLQTFTWVRTVKNGAPNYRLCPRPFGRQQRVSSLPDTWTTDFTTRCLFWVFITIGE